jgi:hypothetical protein
VEIGRSQAYIEKMTRRLLAISVLLLAAQTASAGGVTYLNGPMPFLVPRAGDTPGGYTAAPVPNPDITPPRTKPPVAGEPQLGGSLNLPARQLRNGSSFSPGSTFSDELLRKNRAGLTSGLAPSVGLQVPLDK